jgi:L-fucose dehydrogenase
MELNLKNKVVIVTGGASGIGENICRNLATEGAIVCMIDRNTEALNQISAELKSSGRITEQIFAELTDRQDCMRAIQFILEKFGRIDALVNNAGLNDGVSLKEGDYKKFTESIDKNVGHYMTMVEFSLPALKISRGVIVNICSKTGETGQGGTSGYAAANGARITLTASWASSFKPFGIRVNAVVVAECWTPQYEWWINQQKDPEGKLNAIRKKIPLGNRFTTSKEIADMVLFLISEKSTGIDGQCIHVDGGYVHLDRAAGSGLLAGPA